MSKKRKSSRMFDLTARQKGFLYDLSRYRETLVIDGLTEEKRIAKQKQSEKFAEQLAKQYVLEPVTAQVKQ